MTKRKGVLVILDGYGEGEKTVRNPSYVAYTPFLDYLKRYCPTTYLQASGEAVGLKAGQMGNSETCHLNIGAGRVVPQMNIRITNELSQNCLAKNKKFNSQLAEVRETKSALHLVGLMSDIGTHAEIKHLYSLIDYAVKVNMPKIYLHLITDGRDTLKDAGLKYLQDLQAHIAGYKNVKIASISGRYFAMDRERYMERTRMAFDAMFMPEQEVTKGDAEEYLRANYTQGVSDEFVIPVRLLPSTKYKPSANDMVVFYNFRSDRMRQICELCMNYMPDTVKLVSMTKYSESEEFKRIFVLFPEEPVKNTLTEYLTDNGKKVLKVAETAKYAHVTYFFNGGLEKPFIGEDRELVQGREFKGNNINPAMRCKEVTNAIIKSVKRDEYDLIVANYANPDIIGHTADLKKCIKTLEVLDYQLQRLVVSATNKGYFVVITADHGNIEFVRDAENKPFPAHTTNPVMFTIVDESMPDIKIKDDGSLQDVAPTVLKLLGMKANPDFTGKPLYT
ncbi:MAG: 2,3-bisphosphoglycerate-independent phosphoglycerate mutase [Clostridia bacterium]